MNLGNYNKRNQNNIINHKKIYNIISKIGDNYNSNKNNQNSQNISFSDKINENTSECSSLNSEDINYIPTHNLKDKILSPGDYDFDDIPYTKSSHEKQDILQEDDICYYNNKNTQLKNNKKKLLILDLDETLVHTSFHPLGKDNKIIEPDILLKIFFDNKYYNLYVFTRPYINEFLKDMSKLFIIYIFTASIKEYATPLLNEIDKNNIIEKRLFRDSCTLTNGGKYVKNLNILNYNLKDVILLDNNPISYSFNKANGVPIKSWHSDKNDKELLKMRNFLNFLSSVDDVRYYIPKVVVNDEISYYKVNLMIAQQINLNKNKEEDINYSKTEFQTRNNNRFNNNASSVTPHKKINFNKDEYYNTNKYTKTEGNVNHNNISESVNHRKQVNNFAQGHKINYSSCFKYSRVNDNNYSIKNINSINFNLENKSVKKQKQKDPEYLMTDTNDKSNNFDCINNFVNKISVKQIDKNKKYCHMHRLSDNNIVFNKLKVNLTKDNKNADTCYSYGKKKKINSIYNYSLKKKKSNGKNINVLENGDYYNLNDLNEYEEKNNNNYTKNEKINKIKVNKKKISHNNNGHYNKASVYKNKNKNNNIHIKANNNENKNKNIDININEEFKKSKTFYNNKEDDISIDNNNNNNNNKQNQNIQNAKIKVNGNEKLSISALFKQKYLSVKEPIKLKILKKDNKPDMNNNNLKDSFRINSQFSTNIKSNYYQKRKKRFAKERSCSEFINNFEFYNHYLNGIENVNFNCNDDTNCLFSKKSFNGNCKSIKNNYNINNNLVNLFKGLKSF